MLNALKILVLVSFATVMIGCTTTAEHHSDLQKQDNKVDQAKEYWDLRNVPKLGGQGFKKIAITEFNVEFVTRRYENVFSKAQRKVVILDAIPLARAANFMRIGERTIKLDDAKHQEICDTLYNLYVEKLGSRGLEIVSPDVVSGSQSYAQLDTKDSVASGFFKNWSPIGSDTGRIKSYKVLPAKGLKIIAGATEGDVEQVEAGLLKELSADMSLRVTFRIGVFREFASIESGSTTYITTDTFAGDMSVRRSLLSDNTVIDKVYTREGGSSEYTVDYAKYSEEMNKMLPDFLDLALERVK